MSERSATRAEKAPAAEKPKSVSRTPSRAIDLGPSDEMILQQVEQLDRLINASASVPAIQGGASGGSHQRPPLAALQRRPSSVQRRPSAILTLRTIFDSPTKPCSPTASDILRSELLQYAASEHASFSPLNPPSTGRTPSIGSSLKSAETSPSRQYSKHKSSVTSLAEPSDSGMNRRGSSVGSLGEGSFTKQRKNVASFAEGVANIAHSITKVFDKSGHDEAEEKRQAKIAELVDKEVMVLNAAQLAHIQQRSANPFTISVNSPFRRWWDFIIAVSTAYIMFEVPIKVGFSVKTSGVGFTIDVIVDVIFLLDILLNFFTSYEDDSSGEEIQDIVKIRENYLHGWFIIDAISSFPAALIGTNYELVNLAKVVKLSQVSKISNFGLFKAISTRVNRSMNPSMLRMVTLTLVFVVSQHFIACTYFYISNSQVEHTSWGPSEEIRASSLGEQYIYAFYFAIMVTTANDVSPSTSIEKFFTALMLFVGIVINASIIGSAANLLSNLDKTAIARKNQMDSINEYMRFKKVPLLLQNKIRRYYDYALTSRIRDPTDDLFVDLPDRLKLSLKLNLHEEFIRKAPLFRVCSNAGIIAIIQCLKVVVAMPGEVIVRQGEVANEFYFIKSGRVSISVQSVTVETIPLGNLGEGSFFGETSLLTGEPQGADVHAESIAELAYLTQQDFNAIAEKFPTFHLAVKRISESRVQTAQNVRKMFKHTRQQTMVPIRKGSVRSSALSVMRRGSKALVSKALVSDSSGAAAVRKGTATRFSKRLSSSRRKPLESFNSLYVERLSLTKARELIQIRAISDVVIDNPDEEPTWDT